MLISDASQVELRGCGDAERRYLVYELWSEGHYLLTFMLNDDAVTLELSFGGVEFEVGMSIGILQELVAQVTALTDEERKWHEEFPLIDEPRVDDYQGATNMGPKLEYLASPDAATVSQATDNGDYICCLIENRQVLIAEVCQAKATAERFVILKQTPVAFEMPIRVLEHLIELVVAKIEKYIGRDGGGG